MKHKKQEYSTCTILGCWQKILYNTEIQLSHIHASNLYAITLHATDMSAYTLKRGLLEGNNVEHNIRLDIRN